MQRRCQNIYPFLCIEFNKITLGEQRGLIMSLPISNSEARVEPRLQLVLPIRIRREDSPLWIHTVTVNVSSRGFFVNIEPGHAEQTKRFVFEISDPNDEDFKAEGLAEVRWKRSSSDATVPQGAGFLVTARSDHHEASIKEFIDRFHIN